MRWGSKSGKTQALFCDLFPLTHKWIESRILRDAIFKISRASPTALRTNTLACIIYFLFSRATELLHCIILVLIGVAYALFFLVSIKSFSHVIQLSYLTERLKHGSLAMPTVGWQLERVYELCPVRLDRESKRAGRFRLCAASHSPHDRVASGARWNVDLLTLE